MHVWLGKCFGRQCCGASVSRPQPSQRNDLEAEPEPESEPEPEPPKVSSLDRCHNPTASDISPRRATANVNVDNAPQENGRFSASKIAARRATHMDHLPTAMSNTKEGNRQKMKNDVGIRREAPTIKDVMDLASLLHIPLPFPPKRIFNHKEVVVATDNFDVKFLLGYGASGLVYKVCLHDGQVVAFKKSDEIDFWVNRSFQSEVKALSRLTHSHLVDLIGYCIADDRTFTGLVYEYMPLGSLEDHLHGTDIHSTGLQHNKEPLDWDTRIKIAIGVARGLEYLHDKVSPPIIHRDFKPSNILLTEGYHPKISDFGLAKFGPKGDQTHTSTEVRGTFGFCAPEYAKTGRLTTKSDVYSFGVVLLELITGRRIFEGEQHENKFFLVNWARSLFSSTDRHEFVSLADPRLKGDFSPQGLYQAIEVAINCVCDDARARPVIGDVVNVLCSLANCANGPCTNVKSKGSSMEEVEA